MTDFNEPNGPWDAFIRLRERVEEVCTPLGLRIVGYSLVPGRDRLDNHGAHIMFEIDADVAFASEEEKKTKDEFESIILAQQAAERAQRAEDAKNNLLKITKGGILDDEPAPAEPQQDAEGTGSAD